MQWMGGEQKKEEMMVVWGRVYTDNSYTYTYTPLTASTPPPSL